MWTSPETGRVRVKICGITTVEDARLAIEAGADAVGINMVGGPRRVEVEPALAIAAVVHSPRCPVLLASLTAGRFGPGIEQVVERAHIQWLQLYGDVTPEAIAFQAAAGRCSVPVIRVAGEEFARSFNAFLRDCGRHRPIAVVLDAWHGQKLGGTGLPFEWGWLAAARRRGELDGWPPIILAGGLTPDNVAEAAGITKPWAVDVSSGVESSPGRKDPVKLRDFIREARSVVSA
jgi:phosphoribosylanthranilate isomerase